MSTCIEGSWLMMALPKTTKTRYAIAIADAVAKSVSGHPCVCQHATALLGRSTCVCAGLVAAPRRCGGAVCAGNGKMPTGRCLPFATAPEAVKSSSSAAQLSICRPSG